MAKKPKSTTPAASAADTPTTATSSEPAPKPEPKPVAYHYVELNFHDPIIVESESPEVAWDRYQAHNSIVKTRHLPKITPVTDEGRIKSGALVLMANGDVITATESDTSDT